MKYKLLVILGAAGALGYLFRNQLKNGAQVVEAKLQAFVEDRTEDFLDLKADVLARAEELRTEKEEKA